MDQAYQEIGYLKRKLYHNSKIYVHELTIIRILVNI